MSVLVLKPVTFGSETRNVWPNEKKWWIFRERGASFPGRAAIRLLQPGWRAQVHHLGSGSSPGRGKIRERNPPGLGAGSGAAPLAPARCWFFPSPSPRSSGGFCLADKERCSELKKSLSTAHEKFCFWPDNPCPGRSLRAQHGSGISFPSLFSFPLVSVACISSVLFSSCICGVISDARRVVDFIFLLISEV